jgi:hypothetical protein
MQSTYEYWFWGHHDSPRTIVAAAHEAAARSIADQTFGGHADKIVARDARDGTDDGWFQVYVPEYAFGTYVKLDRRFYVKLR